MKRKDRKALGEYVRHVANRLQLRDWTIRIAEESCDEDLLAHVLCAPGQRFLTIRFCPGFRDLDAEEQRETVVHELVHAHWETCWRMVRDDLAEALGKPVYYVFCDSYRRGMEYGVDALAKTIATNMPLIDWPKR